MHQSCFQSRRLDPGHGSDARAMSLPPQLCHKSLQCLKWHIQCGVPPFLLQETVEEVIGHQEEVWQG